MTNYEMELFIDSIGMFVIGFTGIMSIAIVVVMIESAIKSIRLNASKVINEVRNWFKTKDILEKNVYLKGEA